LAKFSELNSNLMDILIRLISSQNLCKLLTYASDNPFAENDINDTSNLLFNKIFPTPKLPDTVESIQDVKSSLLTVVFDDFSLSGNPKFKNVTVSFSIYCHVDIWQMKGTGKLRPYSIMEEIDNLFNNEKVIGLGKMQFKRSRFIAANAKNLGYRIDYDIVSFN